MDEHPVEPASEPVAGWRVPWSAADTVGVLGLTLLAAVAIPPLLVRVLQPGWPAGPLQTLLVALPLGLLGLLTIAWVHLRHRSAGRLFGPVSPQASDYVAGVSWGAAAFVLFNVVAGLALQFFARQIDAELPEPQEPLRQLAAEPAALPWLFLTAALVAPVAEEIYFRGMLFQALRRRLRPAWGIAVSGLIFALAHVLAEPTGAARLLVFSLILPLGMLLAWLLERRGTLVVPIAAHATFNFMTTLALVAGGSGLMA